MNKDSFINLTPHTITYFENNAPQWSIPPKASPLRLKYNRSSRALELPRVDVIQTDVTPLPPMIKENLYIVSDEVRRQFPWRPDFVSPSNLVKVTDKNVKGCKKFLGNPGMAPWLESQIESAAVLLWPTKETVQVADSFIERENVLLFNLMDRNEIELKGAINIPPGRKQKIQLDQSLPKNVEIAYYGVSE